jgi:hypothetical protein
MNNRSGASEPFQTIVYKKTYSLPPSSYHFHSDSSSLDLQYLLHQQLLTRLKSLVSIYSTRFETDITFLSSFFHIGDLGGSFSRVPGGHAVGKAREVLSHGRVRGMVEGR